MKKLLVLASLAVVAPAAAQVPGSVREPGLVFVPPPAAHVTRLPGGRGAIVRPARGHVITRISAHQCDGGSVLPVFPRPARRGKYRVVSRGRLAALVLGLRRAPSDVYGLTLVFRSKCPKSLPLSGVTTFRRVERLK